MKSKTLFLIVSYYLGIFFILPSLFIFLDSLFNLPHIGNTTTAFIGLVCIILGGINSVYSYWLYASEGKGTPIHTEPSERIIQKGLYKYTRNPIYIGHIGIVFGEFLLLGNVLLFAYLGLFILYIHTLVLREEKRLKGRFGEEYERYASVVPRYFTYTLHD